MAKKVVLELNLTEARALMSAASLYAASNNVGATAVYSAKTRKRVSEKVRKAYLRTVRS